MKRYFLSFFLAVLGISTSSYAQMEDIPATITWGPEQRAPNNSVLSKIITQDEDGFYALRRRSARGTFSEAEKIYIERYDNKNKLRRSERIDLRYKKKVREFVDVIKWGEALFMLSSFHNKAKKINYLFAERIKSNLQPTGDLIKIGEVPTRNLVRDGFFDYHISKDSSKILVYNELPYDKGTPEQFAFHVYNQRFDEVWSQHITLPYNDEMFEVEEYQIDNEGNVYVLGIVYSERNRMRRRGKPTYQYTILAYTQEGTQMEEYLIGFDDYFITDLTFRVASNGNLICSGFYSEKGTASIKGTYFFRLNAQSKEIFNKNLKEFGFDFLTDDMNDRAKAKAYRAEREGDTRREPELYRYALDELIVRSDGGALLMAEQFFVEERFYNDPFWGFNRFGGVANNSTFLYHYHDIIVVNINPNGEIDWTVKIPKRQTTRDDGGYYSSYAYSIIRDKIYFIYNDNRRNFDSDRREPYNFDYRNSIIALTEVRRDGSAHTYPLFENRDANILTRPKVCKQTGRSEMTVYGERSRRFRFATLRFE